MTNSSLSLTLRSKILGALIRNARQSGGKKPEECALAIGITPEDYLSMEEGRSAPSLPELESFAYFLNIPLDYFWNTQTIENNTQTRALADPERLFQIRQRLIGALLKQARLEQNYSIEDTVEQTQISADTMHAYELGLKSIPLPELETICGAYKRSIREFLDQYGPVGKWSTEKQALQEFGELPLELQEFISQPGNRPYLELAQRLSRLDVNKLRAVAEILLEITY